MPTNPVSPNSEAAVDRLALGVDSPRGTEPAMPCGGGLFVCHCFEAESSGFGSCGFCPVGSCFEAE